MLGGHEQLARVSLESRESVARVECDRVVVDRINDHHLEPHRSARLGHALQSVDEQLHTNAATPPMPVDRKPGQQNCRYGVAVATSPELDGRVVRLDAKRGGRVVADDLVRAWNHGQEVRVLFLRSCCPAY